MGARNCFHLCKHVYVLQLFYMDEIPHSLKDFSSNTNFTFVGVEVDDDIAKIRVEYGIDCVKCADIRDLAKVKGA